MDAYRDASIPEPTLGQSSDHQWDPGPDLKSPGQWKRGKSIFVHTCKHHLIQIVVMISALLLLVIGVVKWDVLLPPIHSRMEIVQNIIEVLFSSMPFQNATIASSARPTNWADWWIRVQSFLGVGTLFVALFVWYGEIREDWENDLPKRMSVFFLYNDQPVIVCRYVWLAGMDDLRAWGQQVAAQAAFNERSLQFSPDIKTLYSSLIMEEGGHEICKHHVVCFQLKKLPSSLANGSMISDSDTCPYGRGEKARKCRDRPESLICRSKILLERTRKCTPFHRAEWLHLIIITN